MGQEAGDALLLSFFLALRLQICVAMRLRENSVPVRQQVGGDAFLLSFFLAYHRQICAAMHDLVEVKQELIASLKVWIIGQCHLYGLLDVIFDFLE